MNSQPMLSASRVTKSYKHGSTSVKVLDDITFNLQSGDFTAIMGPSGSGKSTLLHILAGMLTPDSGEVVIGGNPITKMSDANITRFRRRNIGLVFQDFNLIPTLTAEENILLPLILDGAKVDPATLNAVLEQLEISHRRTHKPGELSGGECQRVAIGRALITDPKVIFADEPTGNLDSQSSNRFCELLHRFNKDSGRTIFLVTHNPAVSAWCKRVLFLRDGRICGTLDNDGDYNPTRIADHYLSLLETPVVSK